MKHVSFSSKLSLSLLCLITLLGSFLRLHNLSPNKIYPDSYQTLVVAKNIADYRSVIGYLGPDGMSYPDFLIWTRPGYPLMIRLVSLLTRNDVFSAQLIAVTAGIGSIVLLYFCLVKLFSNKLIALCGAFLLAVSFNHTLWGGFILTETLGVFWVLLTLLSILIALSFKQQSLWHAALTGLFLGCAIMTRFEYILLLVPLGILLLQRGKHTLSFFVATLMTTTAFLLVMFLLLFPVRDTILASIPQLSSLLTVSSMLLLLLFIFAAMGYFLPGSLKESIKNKAWIFSVVLVWLFALVLVLQVIRGSSFSLLYTQLDGPRNFFLDDRTIGIFTLIGMTLLLRQKQYRGYGYIILLTVLLLAPIYYRINPAMERYWTHLLPFLLIASSYGLYKTLRFIMESWKKKQSHLKVLSVITTIGVLILFFQQTQLTFAGIRQWGDKSWYSVSYDEKSAHAVAHHLANKNTLLLVSLPESYFYFSGLSTYSLTDSPPFIYIDNSLNNRPLLIVQDMGMRDIFPHFSAFLDQHYHAQRTTSFWLHQPFHFGAQSFTETHPVVLYTTTVGQLKKAIAEANRKK